MPHFPGAGLRCSRVLHLDHSADTKAVDPKDLLTPLLTRKCSVAALVLTVARRTARREKCWKASGKRGFFENRRGLQNPLLFFKDPIQLYQASLQHMAAGLAWAAHSGPQAAVVHQGLGFKGLGCSVSALTLGQTLARIPVPATALWRTSSSV